MRRAARSGSLSEMLGPGVMGVIVTARELPPSKHNNSEQRQLESSCYIMDAVTAVATTMVGAVDDGDAVAAPPEVELQHMHDGYFLSGS